MSDTPDETYLRTQLGTLGEKFLQRTSDQLLIMREQLAAVAAGDAGALQLIQELAHKIHGSGAMFGFPLLSECGGELERVSAEARPDSEAAQQLQVLLERLTEALDVTRRQQPAP